MKLNRFVWAAFATLFFVTPASAAEWWWLTTSHDGSIFYLVDTQSFEKGNDGSVTYWSQSVNSKIGKSQTWASGKSRWKDTCVGSGTSQRLYLVLFDKDLNSTYQSAAVGLPEVIVPDSIGEIINKFVCNLPEQSRFPSARRIADVELFTQSVRKLAAADDAKTQAHVKH